MLVPSGGPQSHLLNWKVVGVPSTPILTIAMTGRWLGCIVGHQRYSLDNRHMFFLKLHKKWPQHIGPQHIAGQLDSVECFFLCVCFCCALGTTWWKWKGFFDKTKIGTIPSLNQHSLWTQWLEDEISFPGPAYFQFFLTQFHFANRLITASPL